MTSLHNPKESFNKKSKTDDDGVYDSRSTTSEKDHELATLETQEDTHDVSQSPFVQAEEGDCDEVKQYIQKMEVLYEKQQAIFSDLTNQFQTLLSKFLHSYTSLVHQRYGHMNNLIKESRSLDWKNQELQEKMKRLEKTSAMLYQAIGGIVRSPDET